MSKAKHGIAFVVGSLTPLVGHPGAVIAAENPFQMDELTHAFTAAQGSTLADQSDDKVMLAHGYCGGMGGWQGACGGMIQCGAGMQAMHGGMMGGGMMGGGMGMMRMMDTGQDGKVSKEEMTKHHEWMVKAMDANGDGAIDASEMMGMGRMRRMKP